MISRRKFLSQTGLAAVSLGVLKGRGASRDGQGASQASPVAAGSMLAGVVPINAADYEARLEKARALMAANAIDGLFIGGGTNLLYFTNVSWWLSERPFGVVLSRKKPPVWICPAFETQRATELVPSLEEIRPWEEDESPYKLIGAIMKDMGAASGRLGLAPDLRSFETFGLRREVPTLELVDGAVVTQGCRGVKTAKEIGYMDLANKITKLAYREAFKQIKVGMTPQDLGAAVSAAHQRMGVNGGGGPQFGANTAFPHGSRNPRISGQNDIIMVDGGCSVERFSSDVTRTIVFGTPTDKQKKVWDIVKRAQTAALKAARPGAACGDVDQAARKVIEDAGYGPGYKYFAHRLGHGIGMDGHEYPYLVKGNTLKLEPGMTFSNEPGVYIYGEFGIRIEDCMVVTEEGARLLGGLESTAIDRPFGD
jgi:Xaa-Pro dipeptidase